MSLLFLLGGSGGLATPYDLTTVDAVKEFLQKPGTDTAQDALLGSLITRASVAIEREIGREFHPTAAQGRVFSYDGAGRVNLSPAEARTVTAVTWDYGVTDVALTQPGGWTLRDSDPFSGTYRRMKLPGYAAPFSATAFPAFAPAPDDIMVAVTGDWGFADVPADVEHACIVTVSVWLREVAAYNMDGGTAVTFTRRGAVPQDVLDGLDHYRRGQFV